MGEETARSFGLGWAPEAWSRLGDLLLARGLLEFGVQAGLVQRRTDAAEVVALLRRRIPGCVSVTNVNILTVEGA